MTHPQLETPIVFFIFNRTQTTQKVFEVIRQVQPRQLFLVADGPRSHKPDDSEKCAKTRAIVSQVDWDCQVYQKFSDINLGCGRAIASGLDWVFEQVEAAIILEDDSLPDPTFLQFCQELLEKYRHHEQIMDISGFNPLPKWNHQNQSYYFVYSYVGLLGWATWRRAWQNYDFEMNAWNENKNKKIIAEKLKNKTLIRQWSDNFDRVLKKEVDTWDYQWTFIKLLRSGVSIVASRNLIKPIGFSESATHTTDSFNPLKYLPVFKMEFPLKHPRAMVVQYCLDAAPRQYRKVQIFFRRLHSKIRKINAMLSDGLNLNRASQAQDIPPTDFP